MSDKLKNINQHYVSDIADEKSDIDEFKKDQNLPSASMRREAWNILKKRPTFWFSISIIILALLLAFFPFLFTSVDPQYCLLSKSLHSPTYGHWFGFDRQGCDIYARVIYGAKASVLVGLFTTMLVLIIGVTIGALAGFYGGFLDIILSRITDIFFAIPFVLAAIVLMQMFKDLRSIYMVVCVLAFFGWTSISRITRSSVIVIKNYEFVTAAKASGKSNIKILLTHVLPNAIDPIIVYATVALGTFIVAEATLSFMGIGLPPSIISWGADISKAQATLRTMPMVLFYPSIALALTVLSFILLGDVVRDALNPRLGKK